MNKNVTYISNRLSLRQPQIDSLEILSDFANKLTLRKDCDLAAEFEKVKHHDYPLLKEFERDFPCFCFALATGVGKTRLMGAFIAYLYMQKEFRNFFVLAPNLTIYNKLIEDLSNTQSPKYVFPGIGDFVTKPPRIITGDNYNTMGKPSLLEDSITINVFNISKINTETRGGKAPRIKRLSEYIGDSYFNYLSSLDDLVLIMDESHHYRAERGMQVINELKPVLGLELTATPKIERSGGAQPFQNIVYQYSLGMAMEDGFVKEPAVATRKDFDPGRYSAEELDIIKLEDGMRLHEETKVKLKVYADNQKVREVKPFVLVVTRDTEHAGKVRELIQSPRFFDGRYTDKVMEIHSNQRGGEKEENIERLLSLENPLNKIEIVIHVNMLKEGWDVTNLYTIIPLRTAASETLREQTIGRGLRLPYGKRTGDNGVDKLTIIAHDKFQAIIDEANKPDSIIHKENIIEIDPDELQASKQIVVSQSRQAEELAKELEEIEQIEAPERKAEAVAENIIKKAIYATIPKVNNKVKSISELTNEDIRKIVIEKVEAELAANPQMDIFSGERVKRIDDVYEDIVKRYERDIVEIPRITIQPSDETDFGFEDFDLDVKSLNFLPVSEEIYIQYLQRKENNIELLEAKMGISLDLPENLILSELINFPRVDYDTQAPLLHKLTGQAVAKLKSYLRDDAFTNVVRYYKRNIADFIYAQMQTQFYFKPKSYEAPTVRPFTRIEDHNYTKLEADAVHHFTDTITPTSAIPQKVFSGFTKACHNLYKFDSKSEKDFVVILENDKDVLKWLRPAPSQFHIYWDHNVRQYEPDFVAETAGTKYLIEIKREGDIESREVQEKAKAALQYCKYASEYAYENGGKPWKYLIIPHNQVLPNMSLNYFARTFECVA